MTRKDYRLIASAIAEVEAMNEDIPDDRGLQAATLRIVVDRLATWLWMENPRFSRPLFEVACLPIQHARQAEAIRAALAASDRQDREQSAS